MVKKWENGVHITPDEYIEFFEKILNLKNNIRLLIITGLGWDPRMSYTIRCFDNTVDRSKVDFDVHLIKYQPYSEFISPYANYIKKNFEDTVTVVGSSSKIQTIEITTRTENNLYIGDSKIIDIYRKLDVQDYDFIILDVSSLPKSLYLPLLNLLLIKVEKSRNENNLLVSVCQDTDFDREITETPDDTRFLNGFKVKSEMLGPDIFPKIWVPVLEKNQKLNLIKLYKLIAPHDVYPVLPFPSKNPRCDDDILMHYIDLITEWRLDPMNIIYAGEDDPFDLYNSLISLNNHLNSVFRNLGNLSIIITALSSKLSSIGAVMAAYELELEIAHSIGRHSPSNNSFLDRYFNNTFSIKDILKNMHLVWLTGEPYIE